MEDDPPMQPVKARRLPAGTLVSARVGGAEVVCLKVERQGKGYLNHYLVPLGAPAAERRALRLHYIDPEEALLACGGVRLVIEATVAANSVPEVGDAFATAAGQYLKVFDEPQSQRHFAYVDLASFLVCQRRERGVSGLFAWRIEATA